MSISLEGVRWERWGEEAFARARREEKPIFVNVGYSTCTWCHVMERESFADAGIARRMNEALINIRVDREEQPEIDEICTAATRLLTNQAGWPNNLFFTPDLQPYFAGTYFPPEDTQERPSFRTVVESMIHAWENRRDDVYEQAADLMRAMRLYLEERGEPIDEPPTDEPARRALDSLAERFDGAGFGPAPRFPMPQSLWLLHEFAVAGDDVRADDMLRGTLGAMLRGGIYDQLGGGFHRYAQDAAWRVPAFEKLLCDNGMLLEVYARESMRTEDAEIRRVVRETADFLLRELSAPPGDVTEAAFYNAVDARSEGHDGAHYVWLLDEIVNVVGNEDAGFLAPFLGFDREPFFEEHFYVLHQPQPLPELALRRRTSVEEIEEQIAPLRAALLEARQKRPRPEIDTKIFADWNAMAATGLARAGQALGDDALIDRASRTVDFLCEHLSDGHLFRDGEAVYEALLGDRVHLVRALLTLYEITGDERRLDQAAERTEAQIERLGDRRGETLRGFFNAPASEYLLCRAKEVADTGLPSLNGVAVLNLLDLARHRDESRWRDLAEQTLQAFAGFTAGKHDAARTMCMAALRAAS